MSPEHQIIYSVEMIGHTEMRQLNWVGGREIFDAILRDVVGVLKTQWAVLEGEHAATLKKDGEEASEERLRRLHRLSEGHSPGAERNDLCAEKAEAPKVL